MILERRRPIMSTAWVAFAALATLAVAAPANGAEPMVTTAATLASESPAVRPVVSASANDVLDRISLDSTAITGNRELPKVMSIVPWKSAEPPAGPDRPMGSLIEELLAPVDRDEFRREITYYHGLTSQSRAGDARAAERSTASGTPERQRSTTSSPTGAPSQ
jgi:hypothetical protein